MKTVPLKILLIEDSPTDAALLNALLQKVTEFVFQLEHAPELATGIKKISEEKFDVAMLDLGLPDSSGIESYERLRSHAEEVPIIIMTGNQDREVMASVMKQGADNYLVKDAFDGNRVAIAILSAIRNRSRYIEEQKQQSSSLQIS